MGDTIRNQEAGAKKRRSTRVAQALPITVRGEDKQGQAFQEHTSTVSINCYGCRFQSKHEIAPGTWISLEIPHRTAGHAPRIVQARVAWVTPARSGHERVQVGAELEIPGNVWGMAFPPEDWFPYPEGAPSGDVPSVTGGSENTASASGPQGLKVVSPSHSIAPRPSLLDRSEGEIEPPDRRSLSLQVSRIVDEAKQQIERAAQETTKRTSEAVQQLTAAMERAEELCDELSATAERITAGWEEQMQISLRDAGPRIQKLLSANVESVLQAAKVQFDEHVREVIAQFCQQSAKLATANNESIEKTRVEAENVMSTLCASLDAEMSKAQLLLGDMRESTAGLEEAGNRIEALRKTANEELKWHSKRIENQIGLTIERATEQAAKTLEEKAGEITSRFGGQLDHYSRSYVEHTQAQFDDVAGSAAVRAQEVLQQMAETAAASFRSEIVQLEERLRTLRDSVPAAAGALPQISGVSPDWSAATDAAIEDFKKRLENVANSWLLTTAAILNERAEQNLNALMKAAEERLRRSPD